MHKHINNKEQPVVGVYIVSGLDYQVVSSSTGKERLIFPLSEVTDSLYFFV